MEVFELEDEDCGENWHIAINTKERFVLGYIAKMQGKGIAELLTDTLIDLIEANKDFDTGISGWKCFHCGTQVTFKPKDIITTCTNCGKENIFSDDFAHEVVEQQQFHKTMSEILEDY